MGSKRVNYIFNSELIFISILFNSHIYKGSESSLSDSDSKVSWICHTCAAPNGEVTDCCACYESNPRLYKVHVPNTSAWIHVACQFIHPLTKKNKEDEEEEEEDEEGGCFVCQKTPFEPRV